MRKRRSAEAILLLMVGIMSANIYMGYHIRNVAFAINSIASYCQGVLWGVLIVSFVYAISTEYRKDEYEASQNSAALMQQLKYVQLLALLLLACKVYDLAVNIADVVSIENYLLPLGCYFMSNLSVIATIQLFCNEIRFETRIIKKDTSPKEPSTSLWSFLTFSWFDDISGIGSMKPLYPHDLDHLIVEDTAEFICDSFKSRR